MSEHVRQNPCYFCGIPLPGQFENRCSDLFGCRNRVKAEAERLKRGMTDLLTAYETALPEDVNPGANAVSFAARRLIEGCGGENEKTEDQIEQLKEELNDCYSEMIKMRQDADNIITAISNREEAQKKELNTLKEKHEFYRQFLEVQEGEPLFMAIEKLKDEHTRMKKLLNKESVI